MHEEIEKISTTAKLLLFCNMFLITQIYVWQNTTDYFEHRPQMRPHIFDPERVFTHAKQIMEYLITSGLNPFSLNVKPCIPNY